MGWTKLFKSKAGKLKPDPRIRWFGKLPTYADYYSSPTEEDWPVEFHDWMLRGYETYRSRSVATGMPRHRLPISSCVLRLPKSEMTVLASIQDYGGDMRGRPFPICFYVGVPAASWPGPTSDTVAPAVRVLGGLTALKREVPRFLNSPGRFESVFGERFVSLDELDESARDGSWTQQAKAVPLADWLAGARAGLKTADSDVWLRLLARWGENVAVLESDQFEPTLRMPLAAGLPGAFQVAGWLHWLGARMDLGRRMLSLVITGEHETSGGQLSVVAREPLPEDFLLATELAHTLPYLDDAARLTADNQGAGASGAAGIATDATWLDFAQSPARETP